MYGISNPSNSGFGLWSGKSKALMDNVPSDTSISLRNVRKIFNTSMFSRKLYEVIAIADLTLDIPSFGIFVLLGPNGYDQCTFCPYANINTCYDFSVQANRRLCQFSVVLRRLLVELCLFQETRHDHLEAHLVWFLRKMFCSQNFPVSRH